jgi:hypothetical protein
VTAAKEFSAEEVDAIPGFKVGRIRNDNDFSVLPLAKPLELDPATEDRHDAPLPNSKRPMDREGADRDGRPLSAKARIDGRTIRRFRFSTCASSSEQHLVHMWCAHRPFDGDSLPIEVR